jgi:hypothetical protein
MMNRMFLVNDVKLGIHSSMVPTIIGPKFVFTRPGLFKFLTAISKFVARVFIWSLMKKSTVKEIVDYLFCNLPLPFDILRQNNCQGGSDARVYTQTARMPVMPDRPSRLLDKKISEYI